MGAGDFLTVEELLVLLKARGLRIGDGQKASHYLETVGHHRLSPFYAEFFEKSAPDKRFGSATAIELEEVVKLYSFDRRLRLLLVGPLEKIEVALRAMIIAEVGNFLHRTSRQRPIKIDLFDAQLYKLDGSKIFGHSRRHRWEDMRQRVRSDIAKKLRQGIRQHKIDPSATRSDLPAWSILQMTSFGPIVNLYLLLRPEIAIPIAKKMRIHREVLDSILLALIDLRNACAHHEPIWNWPVRIRRTAMLFPARFVEAAQINSGNGQRLYAYCAVIHILLSYLSDGKTTWYRRFKKLINEFDTLYSSRMGLPEDWQTLAFWCVQNVETLDTHKSLRDQLTR